MFSYDFARLDDNERAAAAVIIAPFASDYHRQFARVRQRAPGQQAVVVMTVPALAVKLLDGDRRSWWCSSTSRPTGAVRRSHCLRREGCGSAGSGSPAAGRSPACNHSEHNGWEAVLDRSSSMNGLFLR